MPAMLAVAITAVAAIAILASGNTLLLATSEDDDDAQEDTYIVLDMLSYYGPDFVCMVVGDEGNIECLGSDEHGVVSNAPTQSGFTEVAGGETYACAYHTESDFDYCWGSLERMPDDAPVPTVEPTVESTVSPTAEATTQPTAEPTPTVEPTIAPTATPTVVPTATRTPTPKPTATSTPVNTETVRSSSPTAYAKCDITSQGSFRYPVSFASSWVNQEPCKFDNGDTFKWLAYRTGVGGTVTWSVSSTRSVYLGALRSRGSVSAGTYESEIVESSGGVNPSITFSQPSGTPEWTYIISVARINGTSGNFTLRGQQGSQSSQSSLSFTTESSADLTPDEVEDLHSEMLEQQRLQEAGR